MCQVIQSAVAAPHLVSQGEACCCSCLTAASAAKCRCVGADPGPAGCPVHPNGKLNGRSRAGRRTEWRPLDAHADESKAGELALDPEDPARASSMQAPGQRPSWSCSYYEEDDDACSASPCASHWRVSGALVFFWWWYRHGAGGSAAEAASRIRTRIRAAVIIRCPYHPDRCALRRWLNRCCDHKNVSAGSGSGTRQPSGGAGRWLVERFLLYRRRLRRPGG